MIRTLTGITPSGTLHIGNYFGAMRPAIERRPAAMRFYFIADYHSMTSLFDAGERRRNTLGHRARLARLRARPAAQRFLAAERRARGLELTWLLGTLTPMGLLERAHSYKDKTAKGISPNFGLFAYPVLMAADILLYDTQRGAGGPRPEAAPGDDARHRDQVQPDLRRDLRGAGAEIRDDVAVVPGLDGQKMSKSYGNTIEIFGDEKALRKKIMGIVMDSRTPAEPKPDADKNLAIQLLQALGPGGRGGRLRAAAAGRRPRLRRPEEGAVRALLESLRALPGEARRAGGESGLRGAGVARRRREGPGDRRGSAQARPQSLRSGVSGRAGILPEVWKPET
jgi:tryptophanyl-tRNA synthetase